MRKLLAAMAIVLALVGGTIVAQAQSYVVQRPGQLPASVKRTPSGGYIVKLPRRPAAFVTRTPGGGSIVKTSVATGIRESAADWRLFCQKTRPRRRRWCICWRMGGSVVYRSGSRPAYVAPR